MTADDLQEYDQGGLLLLFGNSLQSFFFSIWQFKSIGFLHCAQSPTGIGETGEFNVPRQKPGY